MTDSNLSHKRCADCKVEKPVTAFSKDIGKKDGLSGYCVECNSHRCRTWWSAHSEEQKVAQKKRRAIAVDKGLCAVCRQRHRDGEKKQCAECWQKTATQRALRREDVHCVDCGLPAVEGRRTCEKHQKMARSRNAITNKRYRDVILNAYGNQCVCCGETEWELLAIDHKNNDGAVERRTLKKHGGVSFYRHIINNDFPSHYQILCHSCNMAKGFYGFCPHTKFSLLDFIPVDLRQMV